MLWFQHNSRMTKKPEFNGALNFQTTGKTLAAHK